jgi:predicted acylesterase/phospholipase RssA
MKKGFERNFRLAMPWIALTLSLQACVSIPARNPVPEELINEARIPGGSLARVWGDALPPNMEARTELVKAQLLASGIAKNPSLLSISGGGANGAFAAGLLKGWTESGQRPDFVVVTGVSTGALIAPFAFLGSDYDDELERFYTTIKTSDVLKRRSLVAGLMSDAMVDTQPLRDILKDNIDDAMISEIASKHLEGRRLFIETTNLDAKRPVIWNIGQIAQDDTEESRQLIHDVLLASASIPGAFPPVRIQVKVGDQVFDELHVDGGTSSQVFLYATPVNINKIALAAGINAKMTVYVIRNGKMVPDWSVVEPKLAGVIMTSIKTLIRTQGRGDLYRIYLVTKRDGTDFKLAYIPDDFEIAENVTFDPVYMRELFDLAYESARNGYDWHESPPGIALP